jgi:SAM-dependent methyltransferase
VHSTSLNRYWNERLDPLDWKRGGEADRRAWRQAFETFLTPETADAIDLLGDLRGKRLLELGSGHGYGALHLARRGAEVVALDVSDRRLAIAAGELRAEPEADRIRPCAANAECLPFPDGHFDAVFSRDVLMYSDPAKVAAECRRVLAPGAPAVFVESLDGHPLLRAFRRWTSPKDYETFTRHLTFDELAVAGEPLEPVSTRAYYLLSLSAFLCLFVLRSTTLHRLCLKVLGPLDDRLLARFPRLRRFAWRATALYRRPEAP